MKQSPPTRSAPARHAGLRITSDGAMGAAGCCLAVSAAAFGVYMNVHGPSASLGTGHDFSVFAQLAPRAAQPEKAPPDGLDMTATASIPGQASPADRDGGVITSVTVEAADTDSATIRIAGRSRTVRVGDDVPGAGAVLAILPGRYPALKTSRGLILARGD